MVFDAGLERAHRERLDQRFNAASSLPQQLLLEVLLDKHCHVHHFVAEAVFKELVGEASAIFLREFPALGDLEQCPHHFVLRKQRKDVLVVYVILEMDHDRLDILFKPASSQFLLLKGL